MNQKKLRRLYREGGSAGAQTERAQAGFGHTQAPEGPNQRWSLNFASDVLDDSYRFRICASSMT
ncbi:hypothetical protein EDD55_1049 [Varunaivibrio sulfuroxidans]|uniref:Uncharacterized protein n=1 Tax=Varunaivibrio sulfuroxidans TaxID=1773489 RepID=A0A4R3JE17_9PROT|nr:hypothetical protein EDD55_1049 [Varunaivibrio sulfuroxidans]